MKHTFVRRMVLPAVLVAAFPLVAAVKTVTWSLPQGWDAVVTYPAIEGYRAIAGGELMPRTGVGEIAEPDLPYFRIRVAMPSGGTFGGVTADVEWEAVDLGGALPLPIAQPVPTGSTLTYPAPGEAYKGPYPAAVAKAEFLQIASGVHMMPIVVTPFHWDGATKTLYKAKTLTVKATFDAPTARRLSLSSASQTSQTSLRSMALSMTINPEDAGTVSSGLKLTAAENVLPAYYGDDTKADYVIISPHKFVELWKEFAIFRKTTENGKSHTFAVKDCDDIYKEFEDVKGDDALKIHRYVERLYDGGKGKVKYVVLGAAAKKYQYDNQTMVPARYIVCGGSLSQMLDMYYGCMDRLPVGTGVEVWDYDGDGAYLGHKNANGSYSNDSNAYIDWMQDIAVFRFPLMERVVESGVELTAGQIMTNFIAKVRYLESDSYPDRYSAILTGSTGFSTSGRGTTGRTEMYGLVVDEREFFDQGLNLFDPGHPSWGSDSEYVPRDHNWAFLANLRGNRRVLMNNSSYSTCTYGEIYTTSGDFLATVCHGWARGAVGAVSSGDAFKATGYYTIFDCAVPCDTGMYDYCPGGSYGITNCICVGEAPILAPHGGALASVNNTRYGWSASWTTSYGLNELGMAGQHSGRLSWLFTEALSGVTSWKAGKGYQPMDAGMALMYAHNTHGGPYATAAWGLSGVEVTGQGDPLAQLSTQHSRVWTPAGGSTECSTNAANWTVAGKNAPQKFDVSREVSVPLAGKGSQTFDVQSYFTAAGFFVGQDEGATLTLANTNGTFKALRETVITNGNVRWEAAGGAGRKGIRFVGARGNIDLPGNAKRYFGEKFVNVGKIRVSGGNVVIDTPRNATFADALDYDEIEFVATNAADVAEWNTLRSRTPGIFRTSPEKHLRVVNSKLLMQTHNVGGSGSGNAGVPLVYATNSTIKVQANPLWKEENFVRPTCLHDSTLVGDYEKFAFGPSDNKGYDLYVSGKCAISGDTPIKLNGQLRIHFLGAGAQLEISNPLCDGGAQGSVAFDGAGTVRILTQQTFGGAVTVPAGVTVEAAIVDAFGQPVVVKEGGTLSLAVIPLADIPSLTVEDGGTLVLPGQTANGIYQIVDAATTAISLARGARVYDGETPISGDLAEGYLLLTADVLYWKQSGGTWDKTNTSAWTNANGAAVAYADEKPLCFADTGDDEIVVNVATDVAPGFMDFRNEAGRYVFLGSSEIAINSLALGKDVAFETPVRAASSVRVTGASAQLADVETPLVEVANGARLRVTGEMSVPEQTIRKLKFSFAAAKESGNVAAVQELRLFNKDGFFYLPKGTKITDIANQSVEITGNDGKYGHTMTGNTGDEQLGALVDGTLGGANKWWASKCSAPTWFEIEFPTNVAAITGYDFYTADANYRNPKAWTVYTSSDGQNYALAATVSGVSDGTVRHWMVGDGTAAKEVYPLMNVNGYARVRSGGTLVADGEWNANLAFADGATLAVDGFSCLSNVQALATLTLPDGTVYVDVTDAGSSASPFPILVGYGLTADDFRKFACGDSAVLVLKDGDLYATTANVVNPPYAATVSASGDWDDLVWTGNGKAFGCKWSEANVRATGKVTLNVTADATLTIDVAGSVAGLAVTGTKSLTVEAASGVTPLVPAELDDSAHAGRLVWNMPIGSTAVIAGQDTVIGTAERSETVADRGAAGTGLLTVGAGKKATLGAGVTFAERNVNAAGWVRFEGARGTMDTSDFPNAVYSFEDASLEGNFEKAGWTIRSAAGDSVRIIGNEANYYARSLVNYEISGGLVEVVPNGESCWFGQTATAGTSAATKFALSGGTFRCLANGTSAGSGLILGYTGGKDEGAEIRIKPTHGLFEVPDSFVNFFNPVSFHLLNDARLRAKGFVSSQSAGVIDLGTNTQYVVNASTLEIGSLGFRKGAAAITMFNGTSILGFERGASLEQGVFVRGQSDLTASVTVAATNGASLLLRDMAFTYNKNDEVVVFGNYGRDWSGTVEIGTLAALPTRYRLDAGVLDVGALGASETASLVAKPANGARVRVVIPYDDYVSGAAIDVFRCGNWAKDLDAAQIRAFLDLYALDAAGQAHPVSGGTLKYLNGLINFIPEGGAGYVFPLSATVSADGAWTAFEWRDRNGVKYTNDWTKVSVAELVCNGSCTVTMDKTVAIGKLVTVTPAGKQLTIEESDAARLSVVQVDDSGSAGTTVLHVTLGAGAVVKSGKSLEVNGAADTLTEHGTIQIPSGGTATIRNGLWNGKVEMADATSKLLFKSASAYEAVPSSVGAATVGGIYYYAAVSPADGLAAFGSDTRSAADGTFYFWANAPLSCRRFQTGLGNGTVQSMTFYSSVYVDAQSDGDEIVFANDSGSDVTAHLYSTEKIEGTNAVLWAGKGGSAHLHLHGNVFVKGVRNNPENAENSEIFVYGNTLSVGAGGIDFSSDVKEPFYCGGTIAAREDALVRVLPYIGCSSGMKLSAAAGVTMTVDSPIASTIRYGGTQPLAIVGEGRVVLTKPNRAGGDVTLKSGTLRLAERGLLNASKVVFGGGKMEVLLPQEEAVFTDPCTLFQTKADLSAVEANTRVLVKETGSEVSGAFTKSGDNVVFTPSAITGITADITEDTDGDWSALPWKKPDGSAVPADVWGKVVGTATLKNAATTRLTFSDACTISSLAINNSGVLDLVGDGTMTAGTVDDSASAGTTRIGAFVKPDTLKAGKDTVVAERGDYAVMVAAGKKLTIPGWTTPSKVTGAGVVALDMGTRDASVGSYWNKSGVSGTNQIVRGTWVLTANAQYPNGKELLVSGPDAVLRFAQNTDVSGYSGCSGALTVEDGGEFQVAMRDTFSRKLCLRNGGKVLMTADKTNGNRAFDLFTGSQVIVSGGVPCVIGGTAQSVSSSGGDPIVNSGIVAIRRTGELVTVGAGAHLDVYAQWGGVDSTGNGWTKTGAGTLAFYRGSGQSGTMTISAGTVRLVNNGQGTTGGIVNNARLEVVTSNGFAKTMANAITGSGALVKNGEGTLVLSGANGYTGATTVNGGTLRLGHASALPVASAVTLAAGTTLDLATARPSQAMAVNGRVCAAVTQTEKAGEQWVALFTKTAESALALDDLTVLDVDGETELTGVEKRFSGQTVEVKCSAYKMPIVLENNSDEARNWTEADWDDSNGMRIPPEKWGALSGRTNLDVRISAYNDTTLTVNTNLEIATFAIAKTAYPVALGLKDGFTFRAGTTAVGGILRTGEGIDLGTVTGSGTLVADGFVPDHSGLDDAENWTGEMRLENVSAQALDVGAFGNAASRVALKNVTTTDGLTVPTGLVVRLAAGPGVVPLAGPVTFAAGSTLDLSLTAFTMSVPITTGGLAMDATVTVRVDGVVRPAGTWRVSDDGTSIELPFNLPLKATVAKSADWTALPWTDSSSTPVAVPVAYWAQATNAPAVELSVEADAALSCASAVKVGAVKVSGTGGVTLPTANFTMGNLTGDGTVVVNGAWPSFTGLTDADNWTGTVVIRSKTGCTGSGGHTFSGLGNANSTVKMDGVSGWFGGYARCDSSPWKGGVFDYELCIGQGGLTMGDGSSENGYCFRKLSGDGTLAFGKAGGAPRMRLVALDADDFTGKVSVLGLSAVTIGTPTRNPDHGTLVVANGSKVHVDPNNPWSAASGMIFASGSTLNVRADGTAATYAISTGTLTLDANAKLQFNGTDADRSLWAVSGGMIVRPSEVTATPEGTPLTSAYDGKALVVNGTAGGFVTVAEALAPSVMTAQGETLVLKYSGAGCITVANGLTANADIAIDARGIDGTNVAKYAVCGAPYSRWLMRGAVTGNVAVERLPSVPKGYKVEAEVLPGYGVRLVVTANTAAKFGAVSVNLRNGNAMEQTDTPSGIYDVPRKMWGDLQVAANNAVTVSNVTFTIGAGVSAYGVNNTPPDAIQKQYMDDYWGGSTRTVTMSNIGYGEYRVIVYYSTDSETINFQPLILNGVYYAATPAGATARAWTIKGANATWGNTGPNHNACAPCEGVNALVSDVMTNTTVTLTATRPNGSNARATIAAIQIVEVGEVYTGPLDYEEKKLASTLDFVLPGTVTTQAFQHVRTDAHGWSTVEVWQRKTGAIETNYTAVSGYEPGVTGGTGGVGFAPLVYDGATVTVDKLEGWLARYGFYNGAHVTVNAQNKFQRDGNTDVNMFLAVDATSQCTINAWGGASYDASVDFCVAAPSGIVAKAKYEKVTAVNYYLTGKGSVCYEAGFTGTHNLKVATIELGDIALTGKKVEKKYLVIGSGNVNADGVSVAGGTKKSAPVSSADDAVGAYYVGKDDTGTYIEWVAHASGEVVIDPADKREVIPAASTNDVKIVCTWTNGTEEATLDLTSAFTRTKVEGGVKVALNPAGTVVVAGESITVTPELTSAEDEQEPLVVGDDVAVGVKTIPGLTYELLRGLEIGDYPDTAAEKRATSARTELRDDDPPAGKAFYIIRVKR